MKLYAIKVKTNRLGVEYPPSPTRSKMTKFYGKLDYVVVTEEQRQTLPKEGFDLICEVKKPRQKAKTSKTKDENLKEA